VGQRAASISRERGEQDRWQATGGRLFMPHFLALLAEAYEHAGQPTDALTALDEAMVWVEATGEAMYHAELHLLKGQLLLQPSLDNATEVESCFHQAISIAQNQSAKSWELRAATSLARLYQQQEKRDEARELLEPIYSWFTEGFDTADLIDAKALLDELA
jgi:predicted ATPase